MSNTKTEKYENISSRDYVPRYLKISRAETMSRLMGREHPAPKPFMDASIYFISRKDQKKTSRDSCGPTLKELGHGLGLGLEVHLDWTWTGLGLGLGLGRPHQYPNQT